MRDIDNPFFYARTGTQLCQLIESPYKNSDNWFLFKPPVYLVFTNDEWYIKGTDLCKCDYSCLEYFFNNKIKLNSTFINGRQFISLSSVIEIYQHIRNDPKTNYPNLLNRVSVFKKLESDLRLVNVSSEMISVPVTIESIKFPLSTIQINQPVTQPQPTKETPMATIQNTMRPTAETLQYSFCFQGDCNHTINLLSFSRDIKDTFVKLRDISMLLSPSHKKIGIRARRASELGVKLFNGIAYLPVVNVTEYLKGMRYCKNNPKTKQLWQQCFRFLQYDLSMYAATSPYRKQIQIVDKVKKKPTYKQDCPIVKQVNSQENTLKQIVKAIGQEIENGVKSQLEQVKPTDLGDTQSTNLKVRNWIQILDINRRQLELQKQQNQVLEDLRSLGTRQQELIEQVHRLTEDTMQQGIELGQFGLKINEILQSYGVSESAAVYSGMTNAEAWKHYTALVANFGKVTGAPYNELHHYCRHIASNRLGIDIEQELNDLRKKNTHATAEPILRAHKVTVRYYLMAHWALIIEGGKGFWEWLGRKENAKATQEPKAVTQSASLSPSPIMSQVRNFLHN